MLKSVKNHDQVQPFAQKEATTLFDRAGVKFKPQLHIAHGCQPYAFVDATGHTSGGLEPSGKADGSCKGSKHGPQVYGRVTGHFQSWTIMYLYYFPKNVLGEEGKGTRHDFHHVVVWVNDLESADSTILAVSVASGHTYLDKAAPPNPDFINGTSVKLSHGEGELNKLKMTVHAGESPPLIMWDQMSQEARDAANRFEYGDGKVAMSDDNIEETVKMSWPFSNGYLTTPASKTQMKVSDSRVTVRDFRKNPI